ncbi:glycoside hydrolase family 127 protein [Seonamhaeicola maritimus]|uniref:Glycoside hydrolase family 127 protein n=1 Tax=Seonamhaeicola maritimus TaxID=2591822 RepID=A0A5C7GDA4_9FLAO|nr:beta-L-arabinofuranosidase domain-containing protein [Seonamhaeicola maritimus]TXG34674.1 glycoside hydrolase family 127 protein [Seonamhaeicola maritimus]
MMKKSILAVLVLLIYSCGKQTKSNDQKQEIITNQEIQINSNDVTSKPLQESGIINYSENSHVALKSINIGDCQWTEGFWADKFNVAKNVMVPYMGEVLCGDVGHALNNFKIAAGEKEGDHKGMKWHDGDFYKFMEAKAYVYAQTKDQKLLDELDEYIRIIGKAQAEDGYLQTQIQLEPKVNRYQNRRYHEMYNTGHLLTSACIHHRVTGKTNFLNIAVKHADYLYEIFMPEDENYGRFGFNQTQIMGLVELYRTVGDKKYLKLAEKFINNRGKYKVVETPSTKGYPIGDMVQEFTPLRKSKEAVGHAVLALYYYAGAADVYAETGEKALIDALDGLWENVTQKKMYITGALGQAHYGASTNRQMIEEGFIDEYMMPNMTAYNETCANICNSMFSKRMLDIHGESKYADIMELVVYNSGLSGISLEGKDYYYANPLRVIDGSRDYSKMNTEFPIRQPYLNCFCCPPNLVRTICKLSGWAYSKSENGIAVNLYGGNKLSTTLLDGSKIELIQKTDYPWEGEVNISIAKCKEEAFDIKLRIPDWTQGAQIFINGKDAKVDVSAGNFAVINRKWTEGDILTLNMPMDVTFIEGHTRIEEVRNQVAVKRGPIVYCLESPDLPKNTKIVDVYLKSNATLKPEFKPDFLEGVTTLDTEVLLRKNSNEKSMYSKVEKPVFESYKAQLVPYYSWSNRGQAEMSVWLPIIWE